MSKRSNRYISVFIPTFNGEEYLDECIQAVLNQDLPKGYELEVIAIDSGSKDGTLPILNKYKDRLILVTIPNHEFSHGGTRAKAAKMAKGEFILFLTQDATPTNDRWLINMLEPFHLSDRVGCVFGRQIPRPFAAATIKREVASVFGALGAEDSIVIHRYKSLIDDKITGGINSFFSDANSAVKRSLLVGQVPFRNVNYAEDQALAQDMLTQGFVKAYAPLGAVWHSNTYTAKEYFHRKFDEFIGLQESTGTTILPSKRALILGWIRPTWQDYKFIRNDRDYGRKRKLTWLIRAPFYNIANQAGRYYAAKDFNDRIKRNKYSLEKKMRG